MDLFKRIQDLSAIYDDDGPSAVAPESRPMFDKGGMAKLVSYVEGLPKGTTVTSQMVQDYANKNNLDVNIKNFFNRNAKTIKDKTFISDTRLKDLKLTSEEKENIEKYGQEKYDKLKNKYSKLRVRKGQDVGSLALDKQQKVKFKKEYDKAIKYYKNKGIEPNMDSIRKNIARNDGKFNATGTKLQSESGLTGLFKNYEKADLIADLKKGKNLSEISIEYFDKNEKQVLKMLEGKRDYSKPLGRLSTDLSNIISTDKEATKLYNKIKKQNSFNKLKNKSTYKKAVETLIPFAQEQGLIPNVNLKGKKINTASDYFNYAYKVKRDPIAKLFGFYERVGIEHPGGVARALIFDDPATLNEIVATMPDTNLAAGSTYDTYATGQARFFEKTKDPKYIKKINKIILNKQKEYGKPRTILDVDGDNVTRRTTKFSLTNPNLIEDSKSFINEYVAAGGSQRKNFNKLDPSLQKSILAFEEGDKIKGNKFLKIALKDTGAEADAKEIKSLIASFGGGTCSVFSGKKTDLKADGGRIGLSTGTPKIDDCFKSGTAVINSGKVPVDKADDFAKLLKRAGNIGRGVMKFGIIPEALYATADSLVRVGMGDTFTEAGLRATDYLLPGDQTKTAEISKVSRIFGDKTGKLVGRTIDYKNQLAKIKSLEDQKANFENLSGGGEFDYIGDLSSDIKNIDNQLVQAKSDLNNKFNVSEAEQLFAERKQEEAYDASKANSFFTRLKSKYGDSSNENNLSDIETLAAPEKTQMELNLDMFPNFRDAMQSEDVKKQKIIMNLPDEFLNSSVGPDAVQYKKDLQDAFKLKNLKDQFGAEQIYGTQGNFAGQPLAGGGIAKMAGDRSGAMTTSMNPDSQGLSYLFNRVKKV